ncbi:MAG: FtsQ-type protein [Clostridia bacterium]|nr:FtsQ-type protein [Clostridia bacterium]
MKIYNRDKLRKKIYRGILFILAAGIIMIMPIWNITQIEVENSSLYSNQEIIDASMLKNKHILSTSFKETKKSLLKLSYIKDASIKYIFPGKVVITLIEREALGYVPFMGTYLCLDESGQVIEQTSNERILLPVIQGLQFTEFKIGEALPIENEDNFSSSIEMINILKKYDYAEKVKSIDVYNLEQIHLYVNNLDVIIGNIGDFDKKLQWLMQAHEIYDMGVLDLSNINNGEAILSPIR